MSTLFRIPVQQVSATGLTQSLGIDETVIVGDAQLMTPAVPIVTTNGSNQKYSDVLKCTYTFSKAGIAKLKSTSPSVNDGFLVETIQGKQWEVSSQVITTFGRLDNSWLAYQEIQEGIYIEIPASDLAEDFTVDISITNGNNTVTGTWTVTPIADGDDAVNINQSNNLREDTANWVFLNKPQVRDEAGPNTGKVYRVTYSPSPGFNDATYRISTNQGGQNGTTVYNSSTVVFYGDETTINSRMNSLKLNMGPDFDQPFSIIYTQEVISGIPSAPYVQETGLLSFTVTPDGENVVTSSLIYEEETPTVFNLGFINDNRGAEFGLDYTLIVQLTPATAGSFQGWTNNGNGLFTFTGDTAAANAQLGAATFLPGIDFTSTFNINLTITRPQQTGSITWSGTQILTDQDISVFNTGTNAAGGFAVNTGPYGWGTNIATTLNNFALITDKATDVTTQAVTYQVKLVLDAPASDANGELLSFGTGGTTVWDGVNTLTITGTKDQVNDQLEAVEWWSRGPQDTFTFSASLYRALDGGAWNLVKTETGVNMSPVFITVSPINLVNRTYKEDTPMNLNDQGASPIISPRASFTYTIDFNNVTVVFSNTSSAGSLPITSYLWTFGDGTTSTQQNPTKTYNMAGTFNVVLRVTNSSGVSDTSAVAQVNIVPVSPVASFTFTRSGLSYNFVNNSFGGSGTATYVWDFGDGTTSTETNPIKSYALDGTYDVTLNVTNSFGLTDIAQLQIVFRYLTWTNITPTGSACAGSGTVFVINSNQSYWRSTNSGDTWTLSPYVLTPSQTVNITAMNASGDYFIGINGDSNLIRSINQGQTWAPVSIPASSGTLLCLAGGDSGTWIAAGSNGNLIKSTNNGGTWATSVENPGNQYQGVAYGNGVWIIAGQVSGDGRIWRSVNDGLSWIEVYSTVNPAFMTVTTNGNGQWIVGGLFGYAMQSVDNGVTWNSLVAPPTNIADIRSSDSNTTGQMIAGRITSWNNLTDWQLNTSITPTVPLYMATTGNNWIAVYNSLTKIGRPAP